MKYSLTLHFDSKEEITEYLEGSKKAANCCDSQPPSEMEKSAPDPEVKLDPKQFKKAVMGHVDRTGDHTAVSAVCGEAKYGEGKLSQIEPEFFAEILERLDALPDKG